MTYQVNPDGTIRIFNNTSKEAIIAYKRAEIPEHKRPVSKDVAKRIIRDWVATNS